MLGSVAEKEGVDVSISSQPLERNRFRCGDVQLAADFGVTDFPIADSMALPALNTPSEVAGKLKVCQRSVYHLIATGQLSGLEAGQCSRIPEEALIFFMGRRSFPALNGRRRLPLVHGPNARSE